LPNSVFRSLRGTSCRRVSRGKEIIMLVHVFMLLSGSFALAFGDDVTGTWKTADGRALIDIYHCGVNVCGRVAWLLEPRFPADDREGMAGKPRVDRHNPNPALRKRSVIGLQIMQGFIQEGANRWGQGTIYDSDTGKTYRSRMTLIPPNRLDLHGYIGIPLLGRSQIWTRQK
jgi:uncharacterized protein (DUF2147 family)